MNKIKISLLLLFCSLAILLHSQDPQTPSAILNRVDSLIAEDVADWCDSSGINYPPDATLLRVFKREKTMQIWAKNSDMKRMRLIQTMPICAMDFQPGPKFQQGDGKTPEGFYNANFLYGSKYYWMWIKLEKEKISNNGKVNDGSSFRICIDYPDRIDRSKSLSFNLNTGGGICIHGNCVTAGCISFTNWNFLPVFAFSKHHNSQQFSNLQVHIFPFDFDNVTSLEEEAEKYAQYSHFSKEQLLLFWKNLKEGYDLFNSSKKLLQIQTEVLTFRQGDEAEEIIEIKEKLRNLSLFNGELSPNFDESMTSAVKQFQTRNNLSDDGVIGAKTLSKLKYITGKYVFSE